MSILKSDNLHPDRGPLRIMNIINMLTRGMGHGPTRDDVRCFLMLRFGMTAQNSETFAALIGEHLIDLQENNYVVTSLGQKLLQKWNVTEDLLK